MSQVDRLLASARTMEWCHCVGLIEPQVPMASAKPRIVQRGESISMPPETRAARRQGGRSPGRVLPPVMRIKKAAHRRVLVCGLAAEETRIESDLCEVALGPSGSHLVVPGRDSSNSDGLRVLLLVDSSRWT